jgi:hypothetical protein
MARRKGTASPPEIPDTPEGASMDRNPPSARDLHDALSLQQDLLEVFASPQPRPDAESLDEVRRICALALITIDDAQSHAYLDQLERHAESFFIADDRVDWAWHTAERFAKLRDLLLRLVRGLGLRLNYLRLRSTEISREHDRHADRRQVRRFAAAAGRAPYSRQG